MLCAALGDRCVIRERSGREFHFSGETQIRAGGFFWRAAFGAVVFEVDEYAHSGYDVEYECTRMSLIHKAISAKPGGRIHMIRYNPHLIRGKRSPSKEEREGQLRIALAYEPCGAGLTITYLFYHLTHEGYPEIALTPGPTLKSCIRVQDVARSDT